MKWGIFPNFSRKGKGGMTQSENPLLRLIEEYIISLDPPPPPSDQEPQPMVPQPRESQPMSSQLREPRYMA